MAEVEAEVELYINWVSNILMAYLLIVKSLIMVSKDKAIN